MWKKSEMAMYGFLLAALDDAAVVKTAKAAEISDVLYIMNE